MHTVVDVSMVVDVTEGDDVRVAEGLGVNVDGVGGLDENMDGLDGLDV